MAAECPAILEPVLRQRGILYAECSLNPILPPLVAEINWSGNQPAAAVWLQFPEALTKAPF